MEITKEILSEYYTIQGKSALAIARQFKISQSTIYKKLIEFNIPKHDAMYENLIGSKFGNWTIKSKTTKGKCEAECSCGRIKKIYVMSLIHGKTTKCYNCRENHLCGKKNPHWKGYEEISQSWWKYNIQKTAEKRNIQFDITIEMAWALFEKQKRKCALTGIELCFAKDCRSTEDTTASLDRIDSSKGYTQENIQWVHRIVNKMKWDLDQNKFIEFCKLISSFNQ